MLRHGTVIVWEFFTGGKTLNIFFGLFSSLRSFFLFTCCFNSCSVYVQNFCVYLFYVGEEHTDMQRIFPSSTVLLSQFRSLFTVSTVNNHEFMNNNDSLNKHHLPSTCCFHFTLFHKCRGYSIHL